MKIFSENKWLIVIITIILLTNLTVIFDVIFLRQFFSFLFLTLLPGLLLLYILRLHRLDWPEKIVLSVGLSVSFIMFSGLLINNLYYSFGYKTPLSITSLIISLNVMMVFLLVLGLATNKEAFILKPNISFTQVDKVFLLVPLLFPIFTIWGIHLMNIADNNIILIFLLILIAAYILIVIILHEKISHKVYPIALFTIAISLLFMLSLRSNHLLGTDTHLEYYFFQTTFSNSHWSISGTSTVDYCIGSTILPSIYQSFLNIHGEYVSKTLYALIFAFAPIAVYLISKRYIKEQYAFLASFYFLLPRFLRTPLSERNDLAIFFVALAVMVLFLSEINSQKKKGLFILFMVSIIVSHYTTAYMFLLIILLSFIFLILFSINKKFNYHITTGAIFLGFCFTFIWYGQNTEIPFSLGVEYVIRTLNNLQNFFILESKTEGINTLLGGGISQRGIPYQIEFVLTWITLFLLAVGVLTFIIKRNKLVDFDGKKSNKLEFLKTKFNKEYFVLILVFCTILAAGILIPYITSWGFQRFFCVLLVMLAPMFVIGGITLAKYLKIKPHFLILIVIIPYFIFVSGLAYQPFGTPRSISLNSEGNYYDTNFIHDQESYSAKWLKKTVFPILNQQKIYLAGGGKNILFSQGLIPDETINMNSFLNHEKIDSYIYLTYYNVVKGLISDENSLTEYVDIFIEKNKIYDNSSSEVWK